LTGDCHRQSSGDRPLTSHVVRSRTGIQYRADYNVVYLSAVDCRSIYSVFYDVPQQRR
jgi:hypothetical protein